MPRATRTTRTPPPTSTGSTASDLRVGVLRLARRLRQERHSTVVSDSQFAVLGGLDRHGPLTHGELAAHEGVQPPSMTRTVALLAELGLVERGSRPGDRRQVVVSLTDAGRAELDEIRRTRDAWLTVRLARLTAQERRTLSAAAEILERLARS